MFDLNEAILVGTHPGEQHERPLPLPAGFNWAKASNVSSAGQYNRFGTRKWRGAIFATKPLQAGVKVWLHHPTYTAHTAGGGWGATEAMTPEGALMGRTGETSNPFTQTLGRTVWRRAGDGVWEADWDRQARMNHFWNAGARPGLKVGQNGELCAAIISTNAAGVASGLVAQVGVDYYHGQENNESAAGAGIGVYRTVTEAGVGCAWLTPPDATAVGFRDAVEDYVASGGLPSLPGFLTSGQPQPADPPITEGSWPIDSIILSGDTGTEQALINVNEGPITLHAFSDASEYKIDSSGWDGRIHFINDRNTVDGDRNLTVTAIVANGRRIDTTHPLVTVTGNLGGPKSRLHTNGYLDFSAALSETVPAQPPPAPEAEPPIADDIVFDESDISEAVRLFGPSRVIAKALAGMPLRDGLQMVLEGLDERYGLDNDA